jgi:hypothetical protein
MHSTIICRTDHTWFNILTDSADNISHIIGVSIYKRIARDIRDELFISICDSILDLIYRSTYEQN